MVSFQKKDRGYGGLVLSSHDKNKEGYKRMNEAGKGKSYMGEKDFLLILLLRKRSLKDTVRTLQLDCPWTGKPRRYLGI